METLPIQRSILQQILSLELSVQPSLDNTLATVPSHVYEEIVRRTMLATYQLLVEEFFPLNTNSLRSCH